jgi:nicotinamide mononucleotide adenylyltransferase
MRANQPRTRYEVGVIHGRFQVLHHDHLRYLLAGRELCRHLVVGVTNPDPTLTRARSADPHRTESEANPLTYYERQVMVRAALEAAGVPTAAFAVVPLPINLPELYRYYVPLDAVFFLTIYDQWGREKLALFQSLGLETHVLWEVPPEEKGLSGREVRERMIRGEPWEPLVPPAVAALMNRWDIPGRLRSLRGTG